VLGTTDHVGGGCDLASVIEQVRGIAVRSPGSAG